jgi:hypothetical protein
MLICIEVQALSAPYAVEFFTAKAAGSSGQGDREAISRSHACCQIQYPVCLSDPPLNTLVKARAASDITRYGRDCGCGGVPDR